MNHEGTKAQRSRSNEASPLWLGVLVVQSRVLLEGRGSATAPYIRLSKLGLNLFAAAPRL
jgi:hypothetical protein